MQLDNSDSMKQSRQGDRPPSTKRFEKNRPVSITNLGQVF